MPKMIVTRGLPGCGKTTFANEYVKNNKNSVNVNLDDIRQMLAGTHENYKFNNSNEALVVNIQMEVINQVMSTGKNIVVSNTNMKDSYVSALKDIATKFGYHFEVKDFFEDFKKGKEFVHEYFAINAFVEQCKERNLLRYKSVPPEVIDSMAQTYYKKLQKVNIQCSNYAAIIVDIDGTLAHMNGKRGPYEEAKVLLDDCDDEVIRSVQTEKMYWNRKVIIMSGRHETCREDTELWLKKHGVVYDHLFMRKAHDYRPDDVVKYELFMEHVAGKFDVKKVFDDRNKVVKMWRNLLGLKVFAVEEGNF